MAGRLVRALKSSVKQDIRQEKIAALKRSSHSQRKKSRSGKESKRKHNTRQVLLTYTGDDPALRRAQSCFQNNLLQGQDGGDAYANCGLTYQKSEDGELVGYNKDRYGTYTRQTRGGQSRYGIGNIQSYERTSAAGNWRNRRS